MNKYIIKVNNATISGTGSNEVSAMINLGIFGSISDMIDYVQDAITNNDAWIYKVILNGKTTIAYVQKVRKEDQ